MKYSNQLKQVVSIKKKLEVEEPMHCWRKGCKEELNGLMHYWIDVGDGFCFDMWLCEDCTKEFKNTRGDKLRFLPPLK